MNLKNLCKVFFAFVFAMALFCACEPPVDPGTGDDTDSIPGTIDSIPDTPDTPNVDPEAVIDSILANKPAYVETDQVYLLGNCKNSDMSASIFGYGDGEMHTFGGATLLPVDKLLDAGYYIVYVSLNDTWFECHATFIGDYWTVFNQVKVGDDYDEVITRIGQSVSSDFYCGSGVWYIRYFYRFENQLGVITFFAATGKVAHVGHVYPGYTGYRMIENENGDVEFYID
jgi:hypothetical protein